jgi:hypothetical protein
MTKLETYECQRCGEKFTIPAKEYPNQIKIIQAGIKKDPRFVNEEEDSKDFCSDCAGNLAIFMSKPKQVNDALKPLWDSV